MRRILRPLTAAALALCLLGSLAACGEQAAEKLPGEEQNTKPELTQSKKLPASKDDPDAETPTDEASLDLLRACMEDTAQVAAVAYLGYLDQSERSMDLEDWLWTNVPGLMEDMTFLQSFPGERVLNGDYGDLYCIVPRDKNTSLAVDHVTWRSTGSGVWPETDEVLYRSESAEPLLLFVRWEEFQDEPDVEVVAVANGGAEVTWLPIRNLEDGGYLVLPTGENDEPLLLDFSSFGDLPGLDYGDDGWFPPTELGLANTTWNYGSWMLELRDSGGASAYAGLAELSYQQEDGQEYQRVDFGAWRMEDDCLYLEFSADSGRFPVLIDPSGEHLRIQQDRDTKARLPFFADGADTMELTLSYG